MDWFQPLSLTETLQNALQRALQALDCQAGGVYLVDKKSKRLKWVAQISLPPQIIENISEFRLDEGAAYRQPLERKPIFVSEMIGNGLLDWSAEKNKDIQSLIISPLCPDNQTSGALIIVGYEKPTLETEDSELLSAISVQIEMTVQNALLNKETQNKLAQLTALQKTTRALVSTLELDELLNLIIEQAATLLDADGGILNLVNWKKRVDQVVACTGTFSGVLGWQGPLDGSLSGWVTIHNQPVISNQIQADTRVDPRVARLNEKLHNALVAPLTIKERATGSLVLVNKHGGQEDFDQADLDLLVSFASQASNAIENARLYATEKRRAEQFRAISEVNQCLALILDEGEALQKVVHIIQQNFGYDQVSIGLLDRDEIIYRIGVGDLWKDLHSATLPSTFKVGDQSISGWVAAKGQSLIVPDTTQAPYFFPGPLGSHRSELAVPIFIKDVLIGILHAQSDLPDAFDENDLILLEALAQQTAATLENIRYYQQAQRLALIDERNRIARELHDAVTQTIFSSSLLAEALPDIWENDPQEGRQVINQLRELSRAALAEMRTLLLELRPAALAETPLEDLLRQLGEAASGRESITIAFNVEGQATLPVEVHIALFRIAQEALRNIVRHARAEHATVSLCYNCKELDETSRSADTSVLLIVSDDGCGFDLAHIQPDHFGLRIIHERAQTIGASLIIDSQLGEGTQVTVLWEGPTEN
jgi:nitrate/nitrite-specific signal transduction histidine kinase